MTTFLVLGQVIERVPISLFITAETEEDAKEIVRQRYGTHEVEIDRVDDADSAQGIKINL